MKQSKHYTMQEIGKLLLSQKGNEGFSNFTLDEHIEMVDIRGIQFSREEFESMYLFSIEKEIE